MKQPRTVVYVVVWTALLLTLVLGASGGGGDGHARTMSGLFALRVQQVEVERLLRDRDRGLATDPPRVASALAEVGSAIEAVPVEVDVEMDAAAAAALAAYREALRVAGECLRADVSTPPGCEAAAAQLALACERLVAAYEGAFAANLEDAEFYRLCIYLLTALLLVRLVQNMRELQARTDDLRLANRTLEQRVDARTRTLSSTNRALETAIAEARRAERFAREAREAAEHANRSKSAFLANMSHEIRTPMTSILGFSERLLETDLAPADRADAVATIRRNGEHLSKLVADVLDLSKIEAGRFALDVTACSPFRILENVRDAMSSRAAAKKIELAVEWVGSAPEEVRTDALRVEQVLFNLVGNAIKFTERGRVSVRGRYVEPPAAGASGKLCFEVEDSGLGMDEATIARLFRPFVQGDLSITRRFGGTGLGLSICRHLVAGLGGTISVSSRPGSGSTFAFDVDVGPRTRPLIEVGARSAARAQETAPEIASAPARPESLQADSIKLQSMRVLIAEDSDDGRRLLRLLLAAAGAVVETVVDGEDAVRVALEARAAGRAFDVVLMDMQMPRVDGYAAASRLRAAGYELPIVALTAYSTESDRERCLAAGCDDYCAKPVRRAVLLETVGRWRPEDTEERPMAKEKRRQGVDLDSGLVELVRLFVEDLEEDVGAMHAALDEKRLDELSMLAHRLKGAAGSYGFPEITRQAAALENAVRGGEEPGAVACELASLEAICEATRRR